MIHRERQFKNLCWSRMYAGSKNVLGGKVFLSQQKLSSDWTKLCWRLPFFSRSLIFNETTYEFSFFVWHRKCWQDLLAWFTWYTALNEPWPPNLSSNKIMETLVIAGWYRYDFLKLESVSCTWKHYPCWESAFNEECAISYGVCIFFCKKSKIKKRSVYYLVGCKLISQFFVRIISVKCS